jgi:60 kDa SS-A/Ro ribonucleoprotein
MANKNLFASSPTPSIPVATAFNEAGGKAYAFSTKHHLAQMACTGMFGDTYHTDAETQLKTTLNLAEKVDSTYVAKLAIYARENGFMKDMPALLAAVLTTRGSEGLTLLKQIFPRVIDNGRMLRTFVQILRSGRVGRKSMGTSVKRLIQNWLNARRPEALFRDSVGNDPSLADIIKMVHPRPENAERQALYRYLIGKEMGEEQFHALPELVREFEAFKNGRLKGQEPEVKVRRNRAGKIVDEDLKVPNVPFQMLTSLNLTTDDWKQIASNGNWHFVRMNINTFGRHGVLNDASATKVIADKLRDRASILNNKVMPYQLLTAYLNVGAENNYRKVGEMPVIIPQEIRNALQDAMEVSIENVPAFAPGGAIVAVDTSGSMGGTVTPESKARYVDVAALFGSAIMRKNPNSVILPFDTVVHREALQSINPRDSVMTNAQKLSTYGGGGTDCASALKFANDKGMKADLVVYVSDNESWVDAFAANRRRGWGSDGSGTTTMLEWAKFKVRNPKARMVNINIAPNGTTQASNDKDILNIGGFSDTIFETIEAFVSSKSTAGKQWTDIIDAVSL